MEESRLYLTDDGSHSLVSHHFGVSYHSSHGAIQESEHIFLHAGVDYILSKLTDDHLRILEMGLGTGLNALLVRRLAASRPDLQIDYLTFEQFPLSESLAAQLNYTETLGLPASALRQLHACTWGEPHQLDQNFRFEKRREDFLAAELPAGSPSDLIFYDAFAPEDQPELWTVEAMQRCARDLRPDGALVTYCAKGQFKRNLRAAGFRVEALPGPVGKREITRAIAHG